MRGKLRSLLLGAGILLLVVGPAAADHATVLNVKLDPGQFVAYRLTLHQPAWVNWGAAYDLANSNELTLPVMAVLEKDGAATQAFAEATRPYQAWLAGGYGELNVDGQDVGIQQGYFSRWAVRRTFQEAGTYTLVLATAPADGGKAFSVAAVEGRVTLHALQIGTTFFADSGDASPVGVAAAPYVDPPTWHLNAWAGLGGEAPVEVANSMYGYIAGTEQGSSWQGPSPVEGAWVLAGLAGTWTASFAPDVGVRACANYGQSCPVDEDRAFAIAADVRI